MDLDSYLKPAEFNILNHLPFTCHNLSATQYLSAYKVTHMVLRPGIHL